MNTTATTHKPPTADQLPPARREPIDKMRFPDFARTAEYTRYGRLNVTRSVDDDGDRNVRADTHNPDIADAHHLRTTGGVVITTVHQRYDDPDGVRTEASLFLDREQARKIRAQLNAMDLD